MSQIFHRSTNTLSRATIFGAVFVVAALGWVAYDIQGSPYVTYAGVRKPQPVPFSHQHHVTGLGIDCRYCHTSVETSSFAGIPPTKTCMNCHSQIWTNAAAARARARQLSLRRIAAVDACQPASRLRLFQSQHSRHQGSRLQHLPWPGRPDAVHVSAGVAADGVVPGLPSRSRQESCGRATRFSICATSRLRHQSRSRWTARVSPIRPRSAIT